MAARNRRQGWLLRALVVLRKKNKELVSEERKTTKERKKHEGERKRVTGGDGCPVAGQKRRTKGGEKTAGRMLYVELKEGEEA